LDVEVYSFIRLITDKAMMQKELAEADIDLAKMPLGNLSHSQMIRVRFSAQRWYDPALGEG
jgi:hypothetical protein